MNSPHYSLKFLKLQELFIKVIWVECTLEFVFHAERYWYETQHWVNEDSCEPHRVS